ncbi:hypothetical protein FOXYSP1_20906 [Fusarium oxysporum f. sp. phaseoli]
MMQFRELATILSRHRFSTEPSSRLASSNTVTETLKLGSDPVCRRQLYHRPKSRRHPLKGTLVSTSRYCPHVTAKRRTPSCWRTGIGNTFSGRFRYQSTSCLQDRCSGTVR